MLFDLTYASFNGESAISLAVLRQPDANTVQVVDAVRAAMPRFQSQLPQSVKISLVNDRSVSIRAALHDVTLTMFSTIVLVVLVIFLFLRRFVATMIPTLSLPVSLVGAISLLWAFGYTLGARLQVEEQPAGVLRPAAAVERVHRGHVRDRKSVV